MLRIVPCGGFPRLDVIIRRRAILNVAGIVNRVLARVAGAVTATCPVMKAIGLIILQRAYIAYQSWLKDTRRCIGT